jgi:hypothetical protein
MPGETTTPNIGLQIAAYNQANWQVPTDFNWNLLDLIFGGEVQVPALDVLSLTIGGGGFLTAASFTAEVPSGAIPGTAYSLAHVPNIFLGLFINGIFQRPGGLDYSRTGASITLNATTSGGDTIYAIYFKS